MKRVIVSLLITGILPAWLSANRAPTSMKLGEKGYAVQAGDSLSGIAHKFHLPLHALLDANKLKANALIHPGQKLRIPSVVALQDKKKTSQKTLTAKNVKSAKKQKLSATPATNKTYKVRPGDTLSTIAHTHGISTQKLREANGLKKGDLIRVGQILKLTKSPKAQKIAKATNKTSAQNNRKKNHDNGLYTVQSGDTLFSIARKYHTPLKDLMSLNGITPTDVIHPGQKLKIPGVSYRATASAKKKAPEKKRVAKKREVPAKYYTVKHGDTLWKIAKKHKVTIAELRKLNHLKPGKPLKSGIKLMVKAGTSSQGPATASSPKKKPLYYTVKHGDSLWSIAKKHKISIAELRKLNHLDKKTVLHSGMKLAVGYQSIPSTRLAGKKKAAKKQKVAVSSKKKSRKVALAKKRRKTTTKRKAADRRIHNALAALNGKGTSRGGDYNVIRIAKRYLGRRYVWGAEGPNTFDCSGFTQYVMRKSKGVRIPRVSRKQAYYGKYVSRRNLKPGDLIFFDTSRRRRGYVNHVGIYIGNNKFIHASSARHRVVITSLNRPFYRARFKWGRRIN
jgi:LysM repeat protein